MKTNLRKLTCGLALLGAALTAPAKGTFTFTLTQSGTNVVGTGSGTVDLTDLTFNFSGSTFALIYPEYRCIYLGSSAALSSAEFYSGLTGPSSFGSGGYLEAARSGTGDAGGVDGFDDCVLVPSSYTSGSALSDSAVWTGQSFATLGVTPGTYTWTYGAGAHAGSVVLQVEAVPEPTTLALGGLGGLGMFWQLRRRK